MSELRHFKSARTSVNHLTRNLEGDQQTYRVEYVFTTSFTIDYTHSFILKEVRVVGGVCNLKLSFPSSSFSLSCYFLFIGETLFISGNERRVSLRRYLYRKVYTVFSDKDTDGLIVSGSVFSNSTSMFVRV